MYKCDSCPYQCTKKSSLSRHELVHKTADEVVMYNCKSCPYKSKRKSNLIKHFLVHKVPENCRVYKCNSCNYESIRKHNMITHLLIHKNADELESLSVNLPPNINRVYINMSLVTKLQRKSHISDATFALTSLEKNTV